MPRNLTEYLAEVVFSGHAKGKRMIFAAPYIDESGTHNRAPIFVLAGYVSTVEKWASFTDEWNAILQDLAKYLSEPVPPFFHMTQFAGNFDIYRPLKDALSVKAEFAQRIFRAIRNAREWGFSTAMRTSDYLAVRGEFGQIGEQFGSAYTFCVQLSLGWVSNWADRFEVSCGDKVAPIIYTLERGAAHQQEADEYLCAIEESPEDAKNYRLSDHIFKDKRDTPPLQAADVLACEAYRDFSRQLTGLQSKGDYYLFDLIEETHDRYAVLDRDRIRDIMTPTFLEHAETVARIHFLRQAKAADLLE